MQKIQGISPITSVADIDRTVAFYKDYLGFDIDFVSDEKTFAIVQHSGHSILFDKSDDQETLTVTAHHMSCYVWVDALDELYDSIKHKVETLPSDRYKSPFDQDYGMREFHIKDPDGVLLIFGKEIG